MLPAITFIFSRKACDEARDACLDAGLRLTTPDERARVRAIVDERTAALADADLDVLGFDRFLAGLEMGVAAHHAGMVPPFKEAVEACFTEGLTKAVFATETLALGVNMPARSVVIERLTKFSGERRELLTPGEYTQLTGRAGPAGHRRGRLRHRALVAVRALRAGGRAGVEPHLRAALGVPAHLQHGRQPRAPLRARARPTTCSTCPSPSSRPTRRSCASRPGSSASRHAPRRACGPRRSCERGDVEEYRQLRAAAQRVARRRARGAGGRGARRSHLRRPEPARRPATCVVLDGTKVAVLSVAFRKGNPRLHVVDERSKPRIDRRRRALRAAARRRHRRAARALQPEQPRLPAPGGRGPAPGPRPAATAAEVDEPEPTLDEAFARRRGPPRGRLPRPRGARAQRGPGRAGRPRARRPPAPGAGAHRVARPPVRSRAAPPRGVGLPRGLVAHRLGRGAGPHLPRVRPAGGRGDDDRAARRPRRPVARRARVVLHLRAPGPRPPAGPALPVVHRAHAVRRAAAASPTTLAADEETAGLPATRPPDAGLRPPGPRAGRPATAWPPCSRTRSCPGGDFVRNVKQLIDLLRGIGDVAPVPATAARARQAADALHRGVVTASSAIEVDDAGGEPIADPKGEPWGSPAPLPRHGVVVRSDAEARAIVTAARRAGEPVPPLGPARRRPVPHPRGHRRRGPPAVRRRRAAARRPRRRARRRPAPLVRRPPRRAARLVARPGRGGHERASSSATWDVAPRGHPNDGRLDVLDADLPFDERLQVRARLEHGTHVPHPRIDERHQAAVQIDLERPTPRVPRRRAPRDRPSPVDPCRTRRPALRRLRAERGEATVRSPARHT